MRSQDGSFYRNADGSTTAIFEHHQHYLAAPGRYERVDLDFRASGSDHVADKNDVIVRVTDRALEATERSSGKGVRWLLPEDPSVSGNRASFEGQKGLSWSYFTTTSGVKLAAKVEESLGPQTYTFPYELVGGAAEFAVSEQGDLLSDAFVVPRAYAFGADGIVYPADSWRSDKEQVVFDFDDSKLPSEAYPYELDPASTFNVGASNHDDRVLRSGSSYPPAGGYLTWPAGIRVEAGREDFANCAGAGTGPFCIRNGFIRWNTILPDPNATITGATLQLDLRFINNADERQLTADWYTAGWPPASSDDYSATAQTSAISGWTIPFSTGLYDITGLGGLGGISKTGYTGLRLHLSGGEPSGRNLIQATSYDAPDGQPPRLTVIYNNTPPPVPTVLTPANAAELPTVTPVLEASTVTDPQGDPVYYQFEVSTTSSFGAGDVVATSPLITSTPTWTVAAGTLKDGATYFWRVRALDQWLAASAWSATPYRSFSTRLPRLGSRDVWPMFSHGPVSVNQTTGNLVASAPGRSYPTSGGSIAAGLSYNSLDATDRGFGPGWVLDAGDALANPPSRLVDHSLLTGADKYDAVEVVFPGGLSSFYTHVAGSNTYQPEPGDTSVLKRNPVSGSSNATWILIDEDGSIYNFGQTGGSVSTGQVTSSEMIDSAAGIAKLSYTFSGSPAKITSITDVDTGRALAFRWNALDGSCSDAILCVDGPDGVTWKYIGDLTLGTSGKLVKVHDGTRDLVQFSYDSTWTRINKIQNANDLNPAAASPGYNATHAVAISYLAGTGKVGTITDGPVTGQTPSSSTWTIEYFPGSVSTSPSVHHGGARTAAGYAQIIGPAMPPGTISSKVFYDNLGRTMETQDTFGEASLVSYNEKDQLVWSEDEDGNPTDNTYDPFDHYLLSTTGPDPDGMGPLLRPVTAYRYDETAIGTVSTPGPALAGLQASYYNNISFSGRPSARQTDSNIDFDWDNNAPASLGGAGGPAAFAVRWIGNINTATAGAYSFQSTVDDGIRVTIDDMTVIDNWVTTGAHTIASPPVPLTAGWHKIAVDYMDAGSAAEVDLSWSCVPGASGTCSMPLTIIPSSVLRPAWGNQTTAIDPAGRLSFHHFADPAAARADYDLIKIGSTNVITAYEYDNVGRTTRKIMPKGNAARTIDASGNLQGTPNLDYSTDWVFYDSDDTAAPPAACGGGAAVHQSGLLKSLTHHGITPEETVYDPAGRAIASTNAAGTTCNVYSSDGRLIADKAPGEDTLTRHTYDPAGATRSTSSANGTPIANDTFTRTVSNAWGTADTGGAWTILAGTAADFDVASGVGTIVTPTGGLEHLAHLGSTSGRDIDSVATITFPNALSGTGGAFGYAVLRRQSGGGYYRVGIYVTTANQVFIRGQNQAGTSLFSDIDTGFTFAAGDSFKLRVQTEGASPTTIRARVWRASTIEPATWAVTSTDSTLGPQLAGSVGVRTYNNSSTATTLKFDDLRVAPIQTVTSEYDEAGRLTRSIDSYGSEATFGYDARGNRTRQTAAIGALGSNPNYTTNYTFNQADQLTSLTDPASRIYSFKYDARGNLHTIQYPNGTFSWRDFNAAGWLTGLYNRHGTLPDPLPGSVPADASPLADYSYSYFVDGKKSQQIRTGGGLPTETESYVYDELGRLKQVTLPSGTVRDYLFDLDSNRTQIDETPSGGSKTTVATYAYSATKLDQLTSVTQGGSPTNFGYTGDGEVNSKGSDALTWDGRGRHSGGTFSGIPLTYGFDPTGQRRSRTASGSTTRYLAAGSGFEMGAALPVASDTYTRQATDSLGTADTGGAWTILAGTAANFDVSGSEATIATPTGSVEQTAHLGGVSVRDVDVQTKVTFPSALSGTGGAFAYALLRRQTSGAYYRIGIYVTTGNQVFIRGQNQAGTSLFADANTGLTFAAGDKYMLRVQAEGASATTLRAKVWRAGTSEPTSWTITASDSSLGPQTAGSVGIRTLDNSSTATTLRIDDYLAVPLGLGEVIRHTPVAGPEGDLAAYLGTPQTSTTVSYLYYNGHGDLAAEANQTGTRTAANIYDPYGAPRDAIPINATTERWTGRWDKQLDTLDGLVQMGVRPYDPALGRFLAVDPVEGGNLNPYDYVGQDPVNGYDLDGQWGWFRRNWRRVARIAIFAAGVAGAVACGAVVLCAVGVGAAAAAAGYAARHAGRRSFRWSDILAQTFVGGASGGVFARLSASGYLGGGREVGGRNFRIGLGKWFGTGRWQTRIPHYHRRPGMRWHRPWDKRGF